MKKQVTTIKKKKGYSIKRVALLLLLCIVPIKKIQAQDKTIAVNHFTKVVVSPHIQVTFKQGDTEKVTIETTSVADNKINIEVHNGTLRIYLDGAKMITKSEKVKKGKWKQKRAIYQGTKVTAIVTYVRLEELSLRGEETFICESLLNQEKFRLTIYGESQVYLNDVNLNTLQTTIYGESYLEIKKGSIVNQKYKAYGESTINSLEIKNLNTKVTAYGSSSFRLHVVENLKITSYGETVIAYTGNPEINKGIIIGDATIQKIGK
ncbi:MAG TPA: DUF2807 domain-containing protein [Flavobacteriia bacterium]|nr:DUF2807 domain-containing protein [Flavobacteriia bacterium]